MDKEGYNGYITIVGAVSEELQGIFDAGEKGGFLLSEDAGRAGPSVD
jgi:hypothetical protein